MSHSPHLLPRRVLGDDCDECVGRSKDLNGLAQLDDGNLRKLVELAQEIHDMEADLLRPQELGASYADRNAVETLRLAARIVDLSGITFEVAR